MKRSIRKYACQFILVLFASCGVMGLFTEIYTLVTGSVSIPLYAFLSFIIPAAVVLSLLITWAEFYKNTPARCDWRVYRDKTGAPELFEWTDGHQNVRVKMRTGEQIGGNEE